MVEAPQPRTVARPGRTARERLLIHGRREALSGAAALMDATSRVIKRLPLPARYLPADAVTLPLGVRYDRERDFQGFSVVNI